MERGGAGLTCNLETDVKKKAKKRDLSKTTKTQKKNLTWTGSTYICILLGKRIWPLQNVQQCTR
jgi:hypothetical protein